MQMNRNRSGNIRTYVTSSRPRGFVYIQSHMVLCNCGSKSGCRDAINQSGEVYYICMPYVCGFRQFRHYSFMLFSARSVSEYLPNMQMNSRSGNTRTYLIATTRICLYTKPHGFLLLWVEVWMPRSNKSIRRGVLQLHALCVWIQISFAIIRSGCFRHAPFRSIFRICK